MTRAADHFGFIGERLRSIQAERDEALRRAGPETTLGTAVFRILSLRLPPGGPGGIQLPPARVVVVVSGGGGPGQPAEDEASAP